MSGILALDISKTGTGWAWWKPGTEKPVVGKWVLGSEYTSDGQTCAKLHQELAAHYLVMPFDRMFSEKPLTETQRDGNSGQHTDILNKLSAHAESFAYSYSIPLQLIAIRSWRSPFIGPQKRETKGPTLKKLTMARCRQLGFQPRDDNEGDALGILTYVIGLVGLTAPWLALDPRSQPLFASGAGR